MALGRHGPVNVDNLNFSEKPGRLTIDLLKILLWIFSCRYCSPKCFFNHRANIEVIISSFIGAIRLNGTSSPPKTSHSKQNIERRTKWAYRRAHLVFHYFLISTIKTYYTFSRRVAVLIVEFFTDSHCISVEKTFLHFFCPLRCRSLKMAHFFLRKSRKYNILSVKVKIL